MTVADSKISTLSALDGLTAATGDLSVVVDVSDTTMSPSGTNKRMTLGELAKAVINLVPGIDGKTIGATTPAAGSFTTLSATGALTTAGIKENAAGNVGIGTTTMLSNAWNRVAVASANSATTYASQLPAMLTMKNTNSTAGNYSLIGIADPLAETNTVAFGGINVTPNASGSACVGAFTVATKASGSTTLTERLRIDSAGNLGVGLTPTARNNTRLQIVDGIGFPVTQVASSDANTLDDYEEGSWTPAYLTTSGSFTYSSQGGRYVKIGQQVTVTGFVTTSSATVGTGAVRITGLPFAINASSLFRGAGVIGRAAGFAGDMPSGIYTIENQSSFYLNYRTAANGASVDLNASDLATGAGGNELYFKLTYFV